jgi:rubrerythrin
MAGTWSVGEILAMAEQIERNGARFYRRAAGMATDPSVRKVLSDLAAWEDGHEGVFSRMRREMSDSEASSAAFDPDGVGEAYLRALASDRVFREDRPPEALLSGGETAVQVLRLALGFERDAILFLLGMRDVVPERLGRDRIQDLIDEEVRHVAYLGDELARQGAR